MIPFLRPRIKTQQVPADKVLSTYKISRVQALVAVFVGYAAFYVVRSDINFSTPELEQYLGLNKAQIGFLTSLMLVFYGISKGIMSSFADKASPRYFMATGLILCAAVTFILGLTDTQSLSFIHHWTAALGFNTSHWTASIDVTAVYWVFLVLVALNGIFQGMGVGPSFITLANWFPRKERGRTGAIWNISHNIGSGIVAPIVTYSLLAFALMYGASQESHYWRAACYWVPAGIAVIAAIFVLFMGKESPVHEGLPPVQEIMNDEELVKEEVDPEIAKMSAFQIFKKYILPNKHAWYVSFVDVFVYMIRFGVLTWLPIYLSQNKGFSKGEMAFAFLCFEWAAIPSTLLAGIISDKLFKGRRMPLAMIALVLIFFCIIGYWKSTSLVGVTIFAATVGCLIYIPQFLSSVQTMEVVPSFAVGSAVGLRGFMSYIFGASLGTSLMGYIVDSTGSWDIGFYILLGGTVCCFIAAFLSDRGAMELARQREAESAKTAAAKA